MKVKTAEVCVKSSSRSPTNFQVSETAPVDRSKAFRNASIATNLASSGFRVSLRRKPVNIEPCISVADFFISQATDLDFTAKSIKFTADLLKAFADFIIADFEAVVAKEEFCIFQAAVSISNAD